jgi:hypothetical protein
MGFPAAARSAARFPLGSARTAPLAQRWRWSHPGGGASPAGQRPAGSCTLGSRAPAMDGGSESPSAIGILRPRSGERGPSASCRGWQMENVGFQFVSLRQCFAYETAALNVPKRHQSSPLLLDCTGFSLSHGALITFRLQVRHFRAPSHGLIAWTELSRHILAMPTELGG